MKVLVIHAWMRGNLGDVLQLSVLMSALRELRPEALDLEGFPARPAAAAGEVVGKADRYLADRYALWRLSPAPVRTLLLRPLRRAWRKARFSRYDAIVCAPGAYLADYDARAQPVLCDVAVADEVRRPVVLSSHSIGPLRPDGLAAVARTTVRIAREPETHAYLRERGISSVLSADLAFLYPYDQSVGPAPVKPPYRAIFLRANNLDARALRVDNGALYEGSRVIAEWSHEPLVLATSDCRRDARFLAATASRLGVPWVGCRSVRDLVGLIAGSSKVVSDRYHPAICAAALGKPVEVVENREPHKTRGLSTLLTGHTVAELQALARQGVDTLQGALRAL